MDLDSANGTVVDGVKLEPFVAMPIGNQSRINFGASKRDYLVDVDTEADKRRAEELYTKIARVDPAADHSDTTVFVA